jgi:hypothetical protein
MLPYMIPSVPPTSAGVTYSPTVGMKTMKKVASAPGRLSGTVTRQKRLQGPAPRSAAASRWLRSMRCIAAYTGSAANGIHT